MQMKKSRFYKSSPKKKMNRKQVEIEELRQTKYIEPKKRRLKKSIHQNPNGVREITVFFCRHRFSKYLDFTDQKKKQGRQAREIEK